MKKLILTLSLGCFLVTSSASAGVFSGSLVTPNGALSGTTNVFQITTNRINITQVMITSAAGGLAQLYNMDNTNAPFFGMFYTNAPYYTRLNYSTNIATSFVGQNGYTNWYTNNYQYYYNSTNVANTNELTPMASFAFVANIPVVMNADILCERGLTIRTTTNLTYVIYYNSGQ